MKGFTLIELIIVVAIIGILAAVAITAYQDFNKTSAMVACKEGRDVCTDEGRKMLASANDASQAAQRDGVGVVCVDGMKFAKLDGRLTQIMGHEGKPATCY